MPAANPDLATMPISVEVGRVHEMARTTRCHGTPTRLAVVCVAPMGRSSRSVGSRPELDGFWVPDPDISVCIVARESKAECRVHRGVTAGADV